ncbi:ABC transporter ATP-binding protein/permease [Solibacillus sp. MA9]|uniref:ABC transporter ATP-binding protein/permease n=1 Tax=Solibacillus palustris TaxID=2908203 RepID=A0ABS9UBY0_9BACL|nr:ABC transporter ATP-binding protein [Solibacillus sp. MA9]MCH7321847.1 ABC transporter ATP-binding protein/permease [Solibacillus sp. MA9]
MKTVLQFARRYKWPALIAFFLMLLELASDLIQPLFMANIINKGLLEDNFNSVAFWGGSLFVLALFSLLSGVLNSFFSAHVAHSFGFDLRKALYSKIQSLTMATYLSYPSSSLITRLTSDVTQTMNIVFMMLRIAMKAPLMAIGSIIIAFVINAKLAFILCISFPFLVIFLVWMISIGIKLFAQVQNRLDGVNRQLQEGLQAVRLIKAYMRGNFEASRFQSVAEDLKFDTIKATRVMEIALPILQFVMNISLLVVIWVGADAIRANDILAGDLAAIINYAFRMTSAFSMFSFIIIAYARAKASAERIEEVLTITDGTEEIQVSSPPLLQSFKIRFDDVSFHYPKSTDETLHNLSFTIQSGEKIAIMGATGSGKSTILQLVENFYEATSGAIYINEKNIQDIPLQQLRHSIAYVPQQSLLFSGSILENLRWGRQDASYEEIIAATKKAQIHNAIESFEHQYETMIGQRGINLSGGQKQRLAIARALLKPSSLLILDDSTSALDVNTEKKLWQALDEEPLTMLVVTQKIHTAQTADRILLIEEGKLSGFGTHEELLQTNKLYKKIVASQQEVLA